MKTFTYTSIGNYVKPKLEGGKELVDALKSGKYAKGKNILRDERDNYCCLGVKCELDGYYRENKLCLATTALPADHPWIEPHGNVLYFPPGFFVRYFSSDGEFIKLKSIAEANDVAESFSIVINILEAAWDCI